MSPISVCPDICMKGFTSQLVAGGDTLSDPLLTIIKKTLPNFGSTQQSNIELGRKSERFSPVHVIKQCPGDIQRMQLLS